MIRLLVVIVHYQTPELLAQCLESLVGQLDPLHDRLRIVDNASGPEGLQELEKLHKRFHHPWIQWIESPVNLGFAGGNNLGLTHSPATYVLLLNPDTIVHPGTIAAMLEFMDQHPNVGLLGPRLEDLDGTGQVSAFGAPRPLSELLRGANLRWLNALLPHHQVYQSRPSGGGVVDWLAGACLMIRTSLLRTIGGLDESYFMYFEEVDFCRRASRAGWPCWYWPEARVVHLVGQASGVTADRQRRRVPAYWFESRHRYFRTHFGLSGLLIADASWLAGHFLSSLRRLVTGRNHSVVAPREVRDFLAQEWRLVRTPLAPARTAIPGFSPELPRQVEQPMVFPCHMPSLWSLIREDYQAHGRDWTRPGFRAMAVYRLGAWRMHIKSRWLRWPLSLVYRSLFRFVRNHYGIEVPWNARIGRRVILEHQHGIVIHGHARIGDGCIIRQGVTLGNRRLDRPWEAPQLGRQVNVGAGAKILGPVHIGDGASIGANAVVLQDIPAGATAVGVPARLLEKITQPQS